MRNVYHDGRDAFRSSMPYLRVDSMESQSIFSMNDEEESFGSVDGQVGTGRQRSESLRGRR